jgi:hypothetical protein
MNRQLTRRTALGLAAATAAAAATGRGIADAQAPAIDGFPLARGTVWTYEGVVRWPASTGPSPELREQTMRQRMEVIEVVTRGHVTAALLRGHPGDLFSPSPLESQPSEYLIVQVGGQFYELRGDAERTASTLARLRDDQDELVNLVHAGDLVLDLPLTVGKRFGEAAQMTRQDNSYVWVVEREAKVQAPGMGERTEFTVRNRTLSGEVAVGFIPGAGISRYAGVHRGTPWEADLRLVEFSPA